MPALTLEVFLRIAAIMLPTVLACGWLMHLAGLWGPRYVMPPPPRKPPRKRPVDQGPETRFADLHSS